MSANDRTVVHAQRWLRFADEDLRVAHLLLPTEPPRVVCYQAQQAAEKAIKSLLVLLKTRFPYTHDLVRLQSLLPDDANTKSLNDLADLTAFSVAARYPNVVAEPSRQDAIPAVAMADEVVKDCSRRSCNTETSGDDDAGNHRETGQRAARQDRAADDGMQEDARSS